MHASAWRSLYYPCTRSRSPSLAENHHPNFYSSFAFVPFTSNCWPAVDPFLLFAFVGAQPSPYMFHRGQESPHERLSGYVSGDSSSPIIRSSSFGVLRRDSWVRKMVLVIKRNNFEFCCPALQQTLPDSPYGSGSRLVLLSEKVSRHNPDFDQYSFFAVFTVSRPSKLGNRPGERLCGV